MKRFAVALFMVGTLLPATYGDTDVVNETFDQYADDTAFQAVWVPATGNGNALANPADVSSGILTSDSGLFPEIQGQAVDHIGASASAPGMVNQFGGLSTPFTINSSGTQSVFLSADIFDGASGNERMSVGLRNRTDANNILEMGFWNANTCDPTVAGCTPSAATAETPGFYPGTGYAYRLINFGPVGGDLLVQPNWQYFQLPQELDRDTDADELVNIADVGDGWHRYTAEITPTSITLELDLFRDELRNTSITPDEITGIRPGTEGVDASVTWQIQTTASGFNSLRIGGPSGLLSGGPGVTAFDNVLLSLIDVIGPGNTADFNGNGVVDAADYTIWQDNVGLTGNATQDLGDADGDMDVDNDDFNLWKSSFGDNIPGAGSLSAAGVPEPMTAALLLFGFAALALLRRNR